MRDTFPRSDVEYLIQRYVSGEITETEAYALESFLDEDPIWARRLMEHRDLHALLDEVCQSEEFVRQVVVTRYPSASVVYSATPNRFHPVLAVSLLGILMVAIAYFAFFLPSPQAPAEVKTAQFHPESIPTHYRYAIVSEKEKKSDDEIVFFEINSFVVWDETTDMYGDAGDYFKPGWLRFQSGVMALLFESGARIVVEGPAEIQLIDSNRADCIRGNVTVNIPEKAIGFKLNVPQTTVVDLGTSFGVEVGDEQTTVHVIEGEVELHGASGVDAGKLSMYGQDAVVVKHGEGGSVLLSTLSEPKNVAETLPPDLSQQVAREREKHRLQATRLSEDSSVLFHFDFSETNSETQKIDNLSVSGSKLTPFAKLTEVECVEGRISDMKSLKFSRPNAMVVFDAPHSFRKMTFATRIRIDSFDHVYNSILTTHSFEPGHIHTHVLYNGVVEVGINAHQDQPGLQFQTEPILFRKLGQWIHLAVTVDAGTQEVAIYLDGSEVYRKKNQRMPSEFRMGKGILGNWTFPKWWYVVHRKRNFNGSMENAVIFSRILSSSEIADLSVEDYSPSNL